MATCPECDAEIVIDDDDLEEMEAGDPWDCEACGSRLRVSSIDPIEFEGDDEQDDEDEDEEADDDEAEESDSDLDDEFDDDDDDDGDDDKEDWDE